MYIYILYQGFQKRVGVIGKSIIQYYRKIEYQLLINNLIDKYIYDKVNNNVDCRLLWDVLKIEIREATINEMENCY